MDYRVLRQMAGETVGNYIEPGLSSTILNSGKIRMFHATRETKGDIVPHSHRFDLSCLVLEGRVFNSIYRQLADGDQFMLLIQDYNGEGVGGEYSFREDKVYRYSRDEVAYRPGDWYHMCASDIHTIRFSEGAKVLIFEGLEISSSSFILEPFVDKSVVRRFSIRDWMFKRNARRTW